MVQQAVIIEHLTAAAGLLEQGDSSGAMVEAKGGLAAHPDDPELLIVLIRSALALGALDMALAAGQQLKVHPPSPEHLDILVDVFLARGELQAARTELAEAEASGALPVWAPACTKARIALSEGDYMAATAILVMATEAHPDVPALRSLLTETLVASGSAGDARAVLNHIGRPPVNPEGPVDVVTEPRHSPAFA